MSRALRALVTLRKKLNQNVLRTAIQGYFPNVSIPKDGLLDFLEEVGTKQQCWTDLGKGLQGGDSEYSQAILLSSGRENMQTLNVDSPSFVWNINAVDVDIAIGKTIGALG